MDKHSKLIYPIIGALLLIFIGTDKCVYIIYGFFESINICSDLYIIIAIIKGIALLGILLLIFFSIKLIKEGFKN